MISRLVSVSLALRPGTEWHQLFLICDLNVIFLIYVIVQFILTPVNCNICNYQNIQHTNTDNE